MGQAWMFLIGFLVVCAVLELALRRFSVVRAVLKFAGLTLSIEAMGKQKAPRLAGSAQPALPTPSARLHGSRVVESAGRVSQVAVADDVVALED